ncbi:hypothetical protein DICPUDRAFT_41003 [Dictyostelium purpureum]|uniref:NADH:flavin oxidoreductase/NADH oxidase N-terminal domain-containing protein n=1 Tax=Dictyostelium purpureum TaxID=5786 RepID=F0ZZ91_DICPU|nr:uncharacterized protein DICPUDRAFT_41003 [Dictyostelium purpureum]EGC30744.1 hypothetical protein DICPUDRAFT_41003 [Dictyostelium purpureum]|eukprot:XP_003292728.1 hypothetical protein DICPUDRAFT_41003 [Dictyostelium purpureum]
MQEFNYKLLNFEKPNNYKSTGSAIELNEKTPKLFTPIQIKEMVLRNRVIISPMCQYSSSGNSGLANEWHYVHYGGFAKGGASMIIMESTAVLPEGRITYLDLGIWSDNHIAPLKKIIDFAHLFDTKVCVQLAHAGRKSSSSIPFSKEGGHSSISPNDQYGRGWQQLSSSPIAWSDQMTQPVEMSIDDIKEVIDAFKHGAIRANKAGFDACELHFSHGYLAMQFLSPTSNTRTDQYGGSFENRTRILFEIIDAVKKVWPSNKPILVRISAEEWVGSQGWTIEDSIQLAKKLEEVGIDWLDVSSGGNNQHQKIKGGAMYQVPFAKSIKESPGISKMLISTVGSITTGNQAESILLDNSADFILFGRPFLRNPNFTYELAYQLNTKIDYALQYNQGKYHIVS